MAKRLIKRILNGQNSAKIYFDSEYGEYRVCFYKQAEHLVKADYHTDDKIDAVQTAEFVLTQIGE